MGFRSFAVVIALLLAACATVPETKREPLDDPELAALTRSSLERFGSEAAFRDYVRRVQAIANEYDVWNARTSATQLAQVEIPCPAGVPPPCYAREEDDVIVTASKRTSGQTASITNNQMVGVDEGDIVKLAGDFLVVLQDGRLFSARFRGVRGPELSFVDRANVYRRSDEDTWYDEMLIHESRIVVIGYSYKHDAAEFSVFTIGADGRFSREATYYISSDDYYSSDNYASRLVGDRLVIRSSIDLEELDVDEPVRWPVIRRWQREERGRDVLSKGAPLLDATRVYRPVQRTVLPVVHTVTVCPLGGPRRGDELECRTDAVVAPRGYTFYVSGEDVWLWTNTYYEELADRGWDDECKRSERFEDGLRGTLFRFSVKGDPARYLPVRGIPINQFSMDANNAEFRALLVWSETCYGDAPTPLKFFRTRLSAFSAADTSLRPAQYVAMPETGASYVENRFTDTHLVYGGHDEEATDPEFYEKSQSGRLIVASVRDARNAAVLPLPHNVIRIERMGDDAIVTGYHDDAGQQLSHIGLRETPRISSTAMLAGRYEAEGRSHAFNSVVAEDGSGLLGIPTVARDRGNRRIAWRSESADVSFLSADASGKLGRLGEIVARKNAEDLSYKCEVSCVDWYGNTRPIFIDGRIFALSGVELVEGEVKGGVIRDLRRVNLSVPPPVHR